MNFIKSAMLKVMVGFLYGCGFMLSVSGAMYFVFESQFEDDMELADGAFQQYDDSANLLLSVSSESITENEFILLGTIQNNGDMEWTQVSLKADLFAEDGSFLDQCEDYVSEQLSPGEFIYFKMSCGSECSQFALQNFSTYKLVITDASNF